MAKSRMILTTLLGGKKLKNKNGLCSSFIVVYCFSCVSCSSHVDVQTMFRPTDTDVLRESI